VLLRAIKKNIERDMENARIKDDLLTCFVVMVIYFSILFYVAFE
jgi:hypothetical protein